MSATATAMVVATGPQTTDQQTVLETQKWLGVQTLNLWR